LPHHDCVGCITVTFTRSHVLLVYRSLHRVYVCAFWLRLRLHWLHVCVARYNTRLRFCVCAVRTVLFTRTVYTHAVYLPPRLLLLVHQFLIHTGSHYCRHTRVAVLVARLPRLPYRFTFCHFTHCCGSQFTTFALITTYWFCSSHLQLRFGLHSSRLPFTGRTFTHSFAYGCTLVYTPFTLRSRFLHTFAFYTHSSFSHTAYRHGCLPCLRSILIQFTYVCSFAGSYVLTHWLRAQTAFHPTLHYRTTTPGCSSTAFPTLPRTTRPVHSTTTPPPYHTPHTHLPHHTAPRTHALLRGLRAVCALRCTRLFVSFSGSFTRAPFARLHVHYVWTFTPAFAVTFLLRLRLHGCCMRCVCIVLRLGFSFAFYVLVYYPTHAFPRFQFRFVSLFPCTRFILLHVFTAVTLALLRTVPAVVTFGSDSVPPYCFACVVIGSALHYAFCLLQFGFTRLHPLVVPHVSAVTCIARFARLVILQLHVCARCCSLHFATPVGCRLRLVTRGWFNDSFARPTPRLFWIVS